MIALTARSASIEHLAHRPVQLELPRTPTQAFCQFAHAVMQLYEVFKGDGGFGGHSASMHKAGLAMFGGHGVRYNLTGGCNGLLEIKSSQDAS